MGGFTKYLYFSGTLKSVIVDWEIERDGDVSRSRRVICRVGHGGQIARHHPHITHVTTPHKIGYLFTAASAILGHTDLTGNQSQQLPVILS